MHDNHTSQAFEINVRYSPSYVCSTFSSRHSDPEIPLLIAQRTHADEPWAAAIDPKRSSAGLDNYRKKMV